MDNQSDSFKEITAAQSERRRVQDFDDLQNEMSGVDVGRIPRFLSPEARAILQEKRNGKSSNRLSALDMMLLTDPAYVQAYNNAMDYLSKAERAAEQGLIKLETQLAKAEAELQSTLDTAAALPDGRKVFRDVNGKVWDEHQNPVDEATAEKIEWRGSEPTNETYLKQKKHVQDINDSMHEVRVYQTDVLGSAREELMDHDNPKTIEKLKSMKEKIEGQTPTFLQSEIQLEQTAPNTGVTSTYSISKPDF